MQELFRGKRRRFSISGALTIAVALIAISAFGVRNALAEPGGGGGGGTCPTPYGPSLDIWYSVGSVGTTSAPITFGLSSSSAMDIALATLEWWDGLQGQSGSIGNIGIGEGSGTAETMTDLWPTSTYSFEISASITCTDSTGTHSYWGTVVGSFSTARMSDWTTITVQGVLKAISPLSSIVYCTWAVTAELSIQSVDSKNSAGVWSFAAGPYIEPTTSTGAIIPYPSQPAALCNLEATGTPSNPSSDLSVGPDYYPNPSGTIVGSLVGWTPSFTLTYDNDPLEVVTVNLALGFSVIYYMDPGANAVLTSNSSTIGSFGPNNAIDILLTAVDVTTGAVGG